MNTQLLYGERHSPGTLPPCRPPVASSAPGLEQTMICLTICMALQMTGYVLILPLFARRFSELGAGVGALGTSEMLYAVAATVCAPFMGAFADRIGRRPVVLVSLAAYALTFLGYLLASSASQLIILRGFAGVFTAGLMPAATSMIADLAPENRRGRWIGILGGGASFGWIAGPVLGGLLFDRWGYTVALVVSIGMAVLAFLAALLGVRETRPIQRSNTRSRPAFAFRALQGSIQTWRSAPLLPAASLGAVFLTYFSVMFAWAFIEPRFMFFAYDTLGWSSSMLGLMISVYGAACMFGEFGLSRLSDDLGRKPIILAGTILYLAQFLGLALFRNSMLIGIAFVIAGLGNALFDPALSASVLDLTPSEHQARMLGLKSTVGSLGNILGPVLVVLSASWLPTQGVFLLAAGAVLLVTLIVAADAHALKGGTRVLGRRAALQSAEGSKSVTHD